MPAKKATRRRQESEFVHQFLVVLTGTDPLMWRRIQVPERYSFWDLHVAIQDTVGWKDYHLHEFRLFDEATPTLVSIGIPTGEEAEDRPVIAGWDVPISRFFRQQGWHEPPATYAYDFGDDWQHVIVHEGLEPADDSMSYPRCLAGEGRCPPEDCGGVHGYAELLAAIADPDHEDHQQMLAWAGGEFDPEVFDPAAVPSTTHSGDGGMRSVEFGKPRGRPETSLGGTPIAWVAVRREETLTQTPFGTRGSSDRVNNP